MIPLEPLGLDLQDRELLDNFKYLDYVKYPMTDETIPPKKTEPIINEHELLETLTNLSQSIENSSQNDYLLSIASFYEFIKDQNCFPQQIIRIINESQFYSNIYTALEHSLYRSPQSPDDKVVIELTLNILFSISYISDDIIICLHENNIIHYLLSFFLDLDIPFLQKPFYYFFGNAITIDSIATEIISPALIEKVIQDLGTSDLHVLAAQLYFIFTLNRQNLPLEYHLRVISKFQSFLLPLSDSFQTFKNDDKFECLKKPCVRSIAYILEFIMENLTKEEYFEDFLKSLIPLHLLDFAETFPVLAKIKIFEIFNQALFAAENCEDQNYLELMIQKLDIDYLYSQFLTKNDLIIQKVLGIFYHIEKSIDKSFILQLLPKDFVLHSVDIIQNMNFDTKVSLLNFISLSILNDMEDEYCFHFLNEQIIDSFTDFDDDKIVENARAVLIKMFRFSYDFPELYEILMPYCIDECFEE